MSKQSEASDNHETGNSSLGGVSESFKWINLELSENDKKYIKWVEQAEDDLKTLQHLTMIPKEYFGRD